MIDRHERGERCEGQFPEGCGATTKEYKHTLNKVMMQGLLALRRWSGDGYPEVHLHEDLRLPYSVRDNFQKMRYFGLVEKVLDEHGNHRRGYWRITAKGKLFVDGVGYCYPAVWSWRGEFDRFEGEPIEFDDIIEGSREAYDYAADALPREPHAG